MNNFDQFLKNSFTDAAIHKTKNFYPKFYRKCKEIYEEEGELHEITQDNLFDIIDQIEWSLVN